MRASLMSLAFLGLVACGGFPSKPVTVIDATGPQYVGKLKYDDAYSGVIKIPMGPDGESFEGRFTTVDQTPIGIAQSTTGVLSQASSASAGHTDPAGYWYAVGSHGSTIKCTLVMGHLGHGQGNCISGDSKQYQIVF